MSAVLVKVDLPSRPEGDLVVITGLGEFPNGEVSLVREDVLAAYNANAITADISEMNFPAGVEVVQLDKEGLELVFVAMQKKAKSDADKAAAVTAKAKEGN